MLRIRKKIHQERRILFMFVLATTIGRTATKREENQFKSGNRYINWMFFILHLH